MKKSMMIIIPLFLGALCQSAYMLIENTASPDGAVLAPYALIPLAIMFYLTGIVVAMIFLAQIAVAKYYPADNKSKIAREAMHSKKGKNIEKTVTSKTANSKTTTKKNNSSESKIIQFKRG